MNQGYNAGGMTTYSGASGACLLVVSETSPDELQAVMSSGGHGGRLQPTIYVGSDGGGGLTNAMFYSGFPGSGSGQLMYFHVGGDA